MNPEKVFAAVYAHNASQIDIALKRGLDPNAVNESGVPLLHEAALVGSAAIVKALLAAGARPDARGPDGDTALMMAVTGRSVALHTPMVEASVDNPGEVDRIARAASLGNPAETIEALLDGGAPVDQTGANGWTPLMLAIQDRHLDITTLLLTRGADPAVRSEERVTPLMLATRLRRTVPEILTAVRAALPAQLDLLGGEEAVLASAPASRRAKP